MMKDLKIAARSANSTEVSHISQMNYLEGKNVKPLQTRCHAQYFLPMVSIIQISFLSWMAHASWVPTNNVKVSSCINPGLCMPLHLRWASIVHRRGEYGNNSGLWIKHTILKDLEETYQSAILQCGRQTTENF